MINNLIGGMQILLQPECILALVIGSEERPRTASEVEYTTGTPPKKSSARI